MRNNASSSTISSVAVYHASGLELIGNVEFVAILANVTRVPVSVQEDSAVASFRGFEFQREFVILVGAFVNE